MRQSVQVLRSIRVSDNVLNGFQSDFTAFIKKCLLKKGIGHDPNFTVGCYDEDTTSVIVEVSSDIILIL